MIINKTKTYLKMENLPRTNNPLEIVVHHTGGTNSNPLLDTSHHTAEVIEDWHINGNKWDGLGYHYVIEKDGTLHAGRPEHRHGAHTRGLNSKSIGICLSGNFDSTRPTTEQTKTLTVLLREVKEKYNIPLDKINPHRKYANKTCYGRNLSDDWARNLIATPKFGVLLSEATIPQIIERVNQIIKEMKK